jgi:hypothetical protein
MPKTAAKPPKQPATRKTTRSEKVVRPGVYEAPVAPKKMGRPSKYTKEIAQEICHRISTGETLLQICRDDRMPEKRTVYDWLARDPELSAQFIRAREAGCDAMAEEALQIANTPIFGQKKVYTIGGDDEDSVTVTEEDALGHRKLQIETRLKLMACWNPKKYGTKVQMGGDPGNPIKIEAQVEAEGLLAAILKNAELKRQVAANE